MRHVKLNILTLARYSARYSIHSMGAFNSLHWGIFLTVRAFKIKCIDSSKAFDSLHRGILLTLLGHLKLLMLTPAGHFIDTVGHLKLNILTSRGEFNSLRQGILLSPSGHLKLNMLTPAAHLIHSDGAFYCLRRGF